MRICETMSYFLVEVLTPKCWQRKRRNCFSVLMIVTGFGNNLQFLTSLWGSQEKRNRMFESVAWKSLTSVAAFRVYCYKLAKPVNGLWWILLFHLIMLCYAMSKLMELDAANHSSLTVQFNTSVRQAWSISKLFNQYSGLAKPQSSITITLAVHHLKMNRFLDFFYPVLSGGFICNSTNEYCNSTFVRRPLVAI